MNIKNSKSKDDGFLNYLLNPQANNQLQIVKHTRDSHKHWFLGPLKCVDKKRSPILAHTGGTNFMETTPVEEHAFMYSM